MELGTGDEVARRAARVFFVALLEAHSWCLARAAQAIRVVPATLRQRLAAYAPIEYAAARADGRIYHGGRRGPRGPRRPRVACLGLAVGTSSAVLSAARVAACREEYARGGVSLAAMARRERVSRRTLTDALQGRTWRTAGGPIAAPRWRIRRAA